ncbi:MAG: Ig-like domain-containing protein, partial [Nocardiaceae bacterium]|nr:Ig-like domain-containing protein [Nocardiaceae bacterium]
QSVTISAKVVAPRTPGGTVQFFDGDKPLGQAVQLVDGRASLQFTFSATGSHSITAKYSGAGGFTASTSVPGTLVISEAGGAGLPGIDTGSLSFGS